MSVGIRTIYTCVLSSLCLLALPSTAQISIAPASLTFPPQLVNSTSATQTVTVTNVGVSPLTISSVAASGGFSIANNCSTVQPGDSCTIDLAYISGLLGATKGILTIADSDKSSPQLVNLSGTAVPPLTLSPSSLNFGAVAVGTASPPKTIKVTANGSAFSIGVITTSGNYSQTNNCPATLPAKQSCTVSLSFVPTSIGTVNGAFAIGSPKAPITGFSASLTGSGTGSVVSQVSIQPKQLNFGTVSSFDLTKRTKTITLTNVSPTLSLTIQSVSVTGPRPSGTPDYQIASNTCKGIIAPAGKCQITVSQQASFYFPVNAPGAVTIVDSDVTSPQVVGLSAAVLAELTFTPSMLVFSPQTVGTTSATQIVTLSSNLVDFAGVSLAPLTVSGDFVIDGSAGSNPCGNSPAFNPGTSCTLGVSFTPNKIGSINGAVSFTMYPECDPELVASGKPCPQSQIFALKGTGQ